MSSNYIKYCEQYSHYLYQQLPVNNEDDEWPSHERNSRLIQTTSFPDLFKYTPPKITVESSQSDLALSHSDSDVSMRSITPANSPTPSFSNVRTDYTCFQNRDTAYQSEPTTFHSYGLNSFSSCCDGAPDNSINLDKPVNISEMQTTPFSKFSETQSNFNSYRINRTTPQSDISNSYDLNSFTTSFSRANKLIVNCTEQSSTPNLKEVHPTVNAKTYVDNGLHFDRRKFYLISLSILLFALIISILFPTGNFNGSHSFSQFSTKQANMTNKDIVKLLDNKIIGQQAAVHRINDSLLSPARDKVILFVGSQGIGKTLAASIIADSKHSRTLILDHSLPLLTSDKNNDKIRNVLKADIDVQLTYWLNQSNTHDTFIFEEVHSVSENYRNSLAKALKKHLDNTTRKDKHLIILVAFDNTHQILNRLYKSYLATRNFTNRLDGADFLLSKLNSFDFTKLIGEELNSLVTHHVPFLPLQVCIFILFIE